MAIPTTEEALDINGLASENFHVYGNFIVDQYGQPRIMRWCLHECRYTSQAADVDARLRRYAVKVKPKTNGGSV